MADRNLNNNNNQRRRTLTKITRKSLTNLVNDECNKSSSAAAAVSASSIMGKKSKTLPATTAGGGGSLGMTVSSSAGGIGATKLKRGPLKERWLLTRKTWKYMTDAGRRIIPDGAHNHPDDIPKIEEYFQQVCRNEPKFLLWRRKASYPGALSSLRRKRRPKHSGGFFSSPPKASSADEADDEKDFRSEQQQQQLIINMLDKFLTDEQEQQMQLINEQQEDPLLPPQRRHRHHQNRRYGDGDGGDEDAQYYDDNNEPDENFPYNQDRYSNIHHKTKDQFGMSSGADDDDDVNKNNFVRFRRHDGRDGDTDHDNDDDQQQNQFIPKGTEDHDHEVQQHQMHRRRHYRPHSDHKYDDGVQVLTSALKKTTLLDHDDDDDDDGGNDNNGDNLPRQRHHQHHQQPQQQRHHHHHDLHLSHQAEEYDDDDDEDDDDNIYDYDDNYETSNATSGGATQKKIHKYRSPKQQQQDLQLLHRSKYQRDSTTEMGLKPRLSSPPSYSGGGDGAISKQLGTAYNQKNTIHSQTSNNNNNSNNDYNKNTHHKSSTIIDQEYIEQPYIQQRRRNSKQSAVDPHSQIQSTTSQPRPFGRPSLNSPAPSSHLSYALRKMPSKTMPSTSPLLSTTPINTSTSTTSFGKTNPNPNVSLNALQQSKFQMPALKPALKYNSYSSNNNPIINNQLLLNFTTATTPVTSTKTTTSTSTGGGGLVRGLGSGSGSVSESSPYGTTTKKHYHQHPHHSHQHHPHHQQLSAASTLLLESLKNYSQSSRNPILSYDRITIDLLKDKQFLQRIRDELKQQQLQNYLQYQKQQQLHQQQLQQQKKNQQQKQNSGSRSSLLNLTTSISSSSIFGKWSRNDSSSNAASTLRKQQKEQQLREQQREQQREQNQKWFISNGQQTDPITIPIIKRLFNDYRKQLDTKQQMASNQQQQQQLQQSTNQLQQLTIDNQKQQHSIKAKTTTTTVPTPAPMTTTTSTVTPTTTFSTTGRRKSSIENEDVSQSVSDTVKRYLRMARKKNPKDNDANRFKRINYDKYVAKDIVRRNSDVQMPPVPTADDTGGNPDGTDPSDINNINIIGGNNNGSSISESIGNTKCCQTDSNWIEQLMTDIQLIGYDKYLPLDKSYYKQQEKQKPGAFYIKSPTSSSSLSPQSPLSPQSQSSSIGDRHSSTSIFHSGTQFFTNLFGHGQQTQQSQSQSQSHFDYSTNIDNFNNENIIDNNDNNANNNNNNNLSNNMQKSKSSSNVSQVFSKSLFKSRSKSHSRTNSPSQCFWLPTNEETIWHDTRLQRVIRLRATNILTLTRPEHKIIRELLVKFFPDELKGGKTLELPYDAICDNIILNLNLNNVGLGATGAGGAGAAGASGGAGSTAIGGGSGAANMVGGGANSLVKSQPKKRAILLKRKAKTTSFFDTTKNQLKPIESDENGFYFGKSLEFCLENDAKLVNKPNVIVKFSMPMGYESGTAAGAISMGGFILTATTGATGADGMAKRPSVHGTGRNSRNSITSLCDVIEMTTGYGGNNGAVGGGGGVGGLSSSSDEGNQQTVQSVNGNAIELRPSLMVPNIVFACIKHIEQFGLNTPGIFRISTVTSKTRPLIHDINFGVITAFPETTPPNDVATILKKFLRELREPLLCSKLYNLFLNVNELQGEQLQINALTSLTQMLPVSHCHTLFVLLQFLAKIAKASKSLDDAAGPSGPENTGGGGPANRMDSHNLATIFAPNILRDDEQQKRTVTNEEAMAEQKCAINVVRLMIDHYQDIFIIPNRLLQELYEQLSGCEPALLNAVIERKERRFMADDTNINFEECPTGSITFVDPVTGATTITGMDQLGENQVQNDENPWVSQGNNKNNCNDNGNMGLSDSRRLFVRQECLHQNAASELNPVEQPIRRRERSSKMKYQEPENEILRRRRRDRGVGNSGTMDQTSASTSSTPSATSQMHSSSHSRDFNASAAGSGSGSGSFKLRSSSIDLQNNSIALQQKQLQTNQYQQQQQQSMIDNRRLSSPYVTTHDSSGGILTASLKIPMTQIHQYHSQHQQQHQNPSQIMSFNQHGIGLNLATAGDIPDIPFIEDGLNIGNELSSFDSGQTEFIEKGRMKSTVGAVANPNPNNVTSKLSQHDNITTASLSLGIATGAGTQIENNNNNSNNNSGSNSSINSLSGGDYPFFGGGDIQSTKRLEKSNSLFSLTRKYKSVGAASSPSSKQQQQQQKQPQHHQSTPSSNRNSTEQLINASSSTSLSSNEPVITPCISNIGGAVLRSKTADFERILQNKNFNSPLTSGGSDYYNYDTGGFSTSPSFQHDYQQQHQQQQQQQHQQQTSLGNSSMPSTSGMLLGRHSMGTGGHPSSSSSSTGAGHQQSQLNKSSTGIGSNPSSLLTSSSSSLSTSTSTSATTKRTGPIYKRKEIISSAQSSRK